MSIEYCFYCDVHIDTDFNAEHFDTEDEQYECIIAEEDSEDT